MDSTETGATIGTTLCRKSSALQGGHTDQQWWPAKCGMRLVCHRVGEKVALRFPDPLGRKDAAGRVITHEFVVFGSLADGIDSVEDGHRLVWGQPQVAEEFARVWELPKPPSTNG